MKRRGIIGILLLGLILITANACGGDDKETTSQQPAEGDINVAITADGNIEASLQMGLTFGSGGKVDKIYVNEGDMVNKGEVLAKLETDALEVALTQTQLALQTAEYNLEEAQEPYTEQDISNAQLAVDEAEYYLWYAEMKEENAWEEPSWAVAQKRYWEHEVYRARLNLGIAQQNLDTMLSDPDEDEIAILEMRVEAAEQSLEQAQKQLDEATITAPFDGTVYKVGAKEGEFLSPAAYTGRTIVEIIDLRHMELVVRVDELDIAKVKTGQKVMISVDGVPEAKLEGWVTFISPVASEPVGVVLFEDDDEVESYEVKIDFDIPEDLPIRAGMSATAEIIVE